MSEKTSEIRESVRRPPASATWTFRRKAGSGSTELTVIREDKGWMVIRFGLSTITFPADLVDVLAEMVAKAAEWEDDQ